jgi:hypothetical protein
VRGRFCSGGVGSATGDAGVEDPAGSGADSEGDSSGAVGVAAGVCCYCQAPLVGDAGGDAGACRSPPDADVRRVAATG